jgi:cytochrome c6
MKKYLVLLLGSLASVSVAQTPQATDAKKLYQSKCARCHGKSGDKGLFHASKLSQSRIDQAAVERIIQTGKGAMPSFSKKLTELEVEAIAAYVLLLRK